MTELRITNDAGEDLERRLTEARAISERLAAAGVGFERVVPAAAQPDSAANQDEVIELYRECLDDFMQRYRFASVDVVGLSPGHPHSAQRRRELGRMHRHQVAEGRLIVRGYVDFCLHAGNCVLALQCQCGDFVGLPAATDHWLIPGAPPDFCSVRLFTDTAECPALPVAVGVPDTGLMAG